MATTTPTTTRLNLPLHLSGNTTELQNELLKRALNDAMQKAYQTAIEQLDRHSAQLILDRDKKLTAELVDLVVEIIHRNTTSDLYKDEVSPSKREYPDTYRVKPIEAQVTELRKIFPNLKTCNEKLARRPLPEHAEAWFAIPRWEVVAPTYNEAVEQMIAALSSKRRISNRIPERMGPKYLRQSQRSQLAEKVLAEQQPGNDILVVGAQTGMKYRGCSARRARVLMEGNEFGLGTFAMGCLLMLHPERLSSLETLMIDCSGDEYAFQGGLAYDRVPLFDYDVGGIEFSMFYEDRARNLWGTPTGFLVQVNT
jgi:hypothetical protein